MHAADAAGDYLYLVERYRQMKDAELLLLLRERGGLTDLACQALESEIHQRRLKPEPEEPPPPIPESLEPSSTDASDEPDLYKKERELVDLCTVWKPSRRASATDASGSRRHSFFHRSRKSN